ncbi:MAG: GAF domain-containing protein [Anaerolineae bacterium]|nr:GAF domain-containing protein [Anaerolineae bacterium]
MAYLLILPICLYTALTTAVLLRQPRGVSNFALASYVGSVIVVTGGYLIMGTTHAQTSAEIAAVSVLLVSTWSYLAFLPLTLIGLYFEGWLRIYWRQLTAALLAGIVVVDIATAYVLRTSEGPLVRPLETGYELHWVLRRTAFSWTLAAAVVLASQIPVIITVGMMLYNRRIARMRSGFVFIVLSLISLLTTLLSPLAGEERALTLAAIGYLPMICLLTLVVVRASRKIPLDILLKSALDHNDGAILIDADYKVLWQNVNHADWLLPGAIGIAAQPHLFEMLRGSPLAGPVKLMLSAGSTAEECDITFNGDTYVIRVDIRPLEYVRYVLPDTSLLLFKDISALHMRRDLDERRRELETLTAISTDIASSLDVDQVIARAVQQVSVIAHVDYVAVYLAALDGADRMELANHLALSPDLLAPPPVLAADKFSADRWARMQEIIIVADSEDGTPWTPGMRKYGLRAGVSVPLTVRDCVIGLLQVGCKEPHAFDSYNTALLESVAQQLAVSIENARLHSAERQQRRRAETLQEVAAILSSENLDEALQITLERLLEVLEYDWASVLLLAEPGYVITHTRVENGFKRTDLGPDSERIEIAQCPNLARLFEECQPVFVPDTTVEAGWDHDRFAFGGWIGVPLIVRQQVLGCLSLVHEQPHRFIDSDLVIAQAFADQVAIAVQNAKLFGTEQQRRVQADQLQQVFFELSTSSDLDTALLRGLSGLANLMEFERAHIGLIDETLEAWIPRVRYGYSEESGARLLTGPAPLSRYPVMQEIIRTKRPIMVPDTHVAAEWRQTTDKINETRSWIGVPLTVRDRVIGVLNLDSLKPHGFSPEQYQMAQTFGNQLASAIENFYLLDEASRQNRAQRALNSILAASNEALTQDNLLSVSLERILETLGIGSGAIHQYTAAAGELRLRVSSNLPPEVVEQLDHIPFVTSLPDIELPTGERYAFFSVPLTSHGTDIGLLSVLKTDDLTRSGEMQDLLRNVGQQLGVVMQNAAMFEDAVQRERLLTDLGRLSLAISAQLDHDTVLALICREGISVFDAQGAYIWLVDNDRLVGTAAHGPGEDWFVGTTCSLDDEQLLPVSVIRDWRPKHVNQVASSGVLPQDFLEATGAQSVLAIPLLKADVPIGTLMVVNTQRTDAFADWIAEQSGLLGVQAALSIQNADLFDEVRHRLDQLRLVNEVGRYATAILSQQSLIEGVAKRLFGMLAYDLISLMQVEDGQLVLFAIFKNKHLGHVEVDNDYYSQPDSVTAEAMRSAQPVICNHICMLHDRAAGDDLTRDCCSLAMPLIVADEVIGVLTVERFGHHNITQADLDVMEPLAAQLAISLSTARLFEKVRHQTIELEARVRERTAQIRQQHERTEAILRSVADAVIVFDLAGQVQMTNPAAKNLFDQYDLDMNLGARIAPMVAQTLDTDRQNGGDSTEIIELGNVSLQAKAARVVEGAIVLGAVVVLRDISRLQELDRMKDVFVSNVSHELRTPLANLKLYLSLIEQGRPERREKYVGVMSREIERLARLISDLLDLSRLQSEQRAERPQIREPVDIEAVVEHVVQANLDRAKDQGDELRHERLSPVLPYVSGDEDQLVRALMNLVSNAINYTPDNGSILIRSQAQFAEHAKPESVIIEVVDNGIGIPAYETPMIFERFYRGSNVNPNIPGTGLGLAIIKEIVELHRGTIEVESYEGQGSTFRITLPALGFSK